MQFVCAVCMKAMTHSVDNVPSQQAVKLVVVGLGFVEQCWFRLFLGDQLQRKMGCTAEIALQSVTPTLKIVSQNALFSRLMRKASLLLPSRQRNQIKSNGSSCIQEFLFEVRVYFSSNKGH